MIVTTLAQTSPDAAESLNGLSAWVVTIMEALGSPGAGLLIALENLFPPLPSEIILPLAGFTASQGTLNLAAVLIWTTVGSVVGAIALYGLGAWLGADRLKRLFDWMPLTRASDITKAEEWFAKHGTKAIFFGRMLPIFRSLISIPAGVERMRLPIFILLTTLGSAVWNSIFVLAGYFLGENWRIVESYADVLQYIVIGAVLAVIAVFVVRRTTEGWRARRTATHLTAATEQEADMSKHEQTPAAQESELEDELEQVWQDESPETARETYTADEVDGVIRDQ